MRLSSHALKFFLFPALATLAVEISVYHVDAVEGEDFVLVKQAEKSVSHGVGRTHGKAQLSDQFVKLIMHNAGLPSFFDAPSSAGYVQTSVLTQSSAPHADHYPPRGVEKKREPLCDNAMVAFLMLNTNDDAYFSHGETSVPVKEGTMVTFPGNVVHHTVITSGSVKLLGPFDVLGMQSVGGGDNDDTPTPKSSNSPTIKSSKKANIRRDLL
jgi:hypothetical protein